MKASKSLKQCMAVCSKHRRHTTTMQNIGKMVKKTNYDSYTNGNSLIMKIKFLLNIINQ
jgi:hypothetical protein